MKVLNIPNWDRTLELLENILSNNPQIRDKATRLPKIYEGNRGLMVVDVVSSRQRKYETYVKSKLVPQYKSKISDLSLSYLSMNAPDWMPLRKGEAQTMSEVSKLLTSYGIENNISKEDEICFVWAHDVDAQQSMLDINGIGPALLQYLRMLSGADTLKVDVRVIETLRQAGLPVDWFSAEGIFQLCKSISREIGCSMVELDQMLWYFLELKK